MNDADLLQRIAQILRQEIGPAIDAEYPKTQAFMAAVVLQKVGRQLALAAEHTAAETADVTALLADLRELVRGDAPPAVRDAIDGLAQARDSAALSRLVETLYVSRAELGERRFFTVLDRIRLTMRRSIDRRMTIAG